MKILQWNVWYQERAANVLKLLEEVQADIVCLQECTINNPTYNVNIDVPGLLAEKLGYYKYFVPVYPDTGDGLYGNAILSRYPILSSRNVFTQIGKSNTTDYSQESRVYIELVLDTPTGPLTVGTTHMSYVHKFAVTDAKKRETDMLVHELSKNKERFYFSGDLNALPESYVLQEVSKVLTHVGPDVVQNTWDTKNFNYEGFVGGALHWRLDYCFATPDIAVVSSKIIPTEYSDHLPIVVTIAD
jgi:endonuclease/exonuclease/phosphatase family metal-dependent hydrolase